MSAQNQKGIERLLTSFLSSHPELWEWIHPHVPKELIIAGLLDSIAKELGEPDISRKVSALSHEIKALGVEKINHAAKKLEPQLS